jgi:hypothetical protein
MLDRNPMPPPASSDCCQRKHAGISYGFGIRTKWSPGYKGASVQARAMPPAGSESLVYCAQRISGQTLNETLGGSG